MNIKIKILRQDSNPDMNTLPAGAVVGVRGDSLHSESETLRLDNGQHVLRVDRAVSYDIVESDDDDAIAAAGVGGDGAGGDGAGGGGASAAGAGAAGAGAAGDGGVLYEVLPQIHKDMTRGGKLYMNHFPHECDNAEWTVKLVNCVKQLGPAVDIVQAILGSCPVEVPTGVFMDPHLILKQLTTDGRMRKVRLTNSTRLYWTRNLVTAEACLHFLQAVILTMHTHARTRAHITRMMM